MAPAGVNRRPRMEGQGTEPIGNYPKHPKITWDMKS